MIRRLRAVGAFWYGFVIGDDWRVAVGVVVTLAQASLWIYLTHWQVYWPLEEAGHRWYAALASILVGIAAARACAAVQHRCHRRWRRDGPWAVVSAAR